MRRCRWLVVAIVLALCIGAATTVLAQRRRGFGYGAPLRMATADSFDGGFNFCRIIFSQSRDGDDGGNWSVDYPRADVNLSIRLGELTRTRISRDASTGEPNHVLLRLTDDLLFQCPFIMMTEVGSAYFTPEETERLREYLLKGGFLWADDFWGEYAWEIWSREIGKALPPSEYAAVDLPRAHPIFRTQFVVDKVPQIPSIGHWYTSGGGTSERPDSQEAHARAIFDKTGRMMVFMTHNTDFGDAFEQEATDPRYFYAFSVDGYAFGINVLLYALTH
ncbi:MAG: DUF4159 domain-containing protein [Acidobacteriota bacterium]|nr:DUF4159 domain-containing protein [Acidobacteriota bacterium]